MQIKTKSPAHRIENLDVGVPWIRCPMLELNR